MQTAQKSLSMPEKALWWKYEYSLDGSTNLGPVYVGPGNPDHWGKLLDNDNETSRAAMAASFKDSYKIILEAKRQGEISPDDLEKAKKVGVGKILHFYNIGILSNQIDKFIKDNNLKVAIDQFTPTAAGSRTLVLVTLGGMERGILENPLVGHMTEAAYEANETLQDVYGRRADPFDLMGASLTKNDNNDTSAFIETFFNLEEGEGPATLKIVASVMEELDGFRKANKARIAGNAKTLQLGSYAAELRQYIFKLEQVLEINREGMLSTPKAVTSTEGTPQILRAFSPTQDGADWYAKKNAIHFEYIFVEENNERLENAMQVLASTTIAKSKRKINEIYYELGIGAEYLCRTGFSFPKELIHNAPAIAALRNSEYWRSTDPHIRFKHFIEDIKLSGFHASGPVEFKNTEETNEEAKEKNLNLNDKKSEIAANNIATQVGQGSPSREVSDKTAEKIFNRTKKLTVFAGDRVTNELFNVGINEITTVDGMYRAIFNKINILSLADFIMECLLGSADQKLKDMVAGLGIASAIMTYFGAEYIEKMLDDDDKKSKEQQMNPVAKKEMRDNLSAAKLQGKNKLEQKVMAPIAKHLSKHIAETGLLNWFPSFWQDLNGYQKGILKPAIRAAFNSAGLGDLARHLDVGSHQSYLEGATTSAGMNLAKDMRDGVTDKNKTKSAMQKKSKTPPTVPFADNASGMFVDFLATMLTSVIDAVMKQIQQYIMDVIREKVKTALDIIWDSICGQDKQNYGATDANSLVTKQAALEVAEQCEITQEALSAFLSSVSTMLTTPELCKLFSGKANSALLRRALNHIKDKFPSLLGCFGTETLVRNLFVTLGESVPDELCREAIAVAAQPPAVASATGEICIDVSVQDIVKQSLQGKGSAAWVQEQLEKNLKEDEEALLDLTLEKIMGSRLLEQQLQSFVEKEIKPIANNDAFVVSAFNVAVDMAFDSIYSTWLLDVEKARENLGSLENVYDLTAAYRNIWLGPNKVQLAPMAPPNLSFNKFEIDTYFLEALEIDEDIAVTIDIPPNGDEYDIKIRDAQGNVIFEYIHEATTDSDPSQVEEFVDKVYNKWYTFLTETAGEQADGLDLSPLENIRTEAKAQFPYLFAQLIKSVARVVEKESKFFLDKETLKNFKLEGLLNIGQPNGVKELVNERYKGYANIMEMNEAIRFSSLEGGLAAFFQLLSLEMMVIGLNAIQLSGTFKKHADGLLHGLLLTRVTATEYQRILNWSLEVIESRKKIDKDLFIPEEKLEDDVAPRRGVKELKFLLKEAYETAVTNFENMFYSSVSGNIGADVDDLMQKFIKEAFLLVNVPRRIIAPLPQSRIYDTNYDNKLGVALPNTFYTRFGNLILERYIKVGKEKWPQDWVFGTTVKPTTLEVLDVDKSGDLDSQELLNLPEIEKLGEWYAPPKLVQEISRWNDVCSKWFGSSQQSHHGFDFIDQCGDHLMGKINIDAWRELIAEAFPEKEVINKFHVVPILPETGKLDWDHGLEIPYWAYSNYYKPRADETTWGGKGLDPDVGGLAIPDSALYFKLPTTFPGAEQNWTEKQKEAWSQLAPWHQYPWTWKIQLMSDVELIKASALKQSDVVERSSLHKSIDDTPGNMKQIPDGTESWMKVHEKRRFFYLGPRDPNNTKKPLEAVGPSSPDDPRIDFMYKADIVQDSGDVFKKHFWGTRNVWDVKNLGADADIKLAITDGWYHRTGDMPHGDLLTYGHWLKDLPKDGDWNHGGTKLSHAPITGPADDPGLTYLSWARLAKIKKYYDYILEDPNNPYAGVSPGGNIGAHHVLKAQRFPHEYWKAATRTNVYRDPQHVFTFLPPECPDATYGFYEGEFKFSPAAEADFGTWGEDKVGIWREEGWDFYLTRYMPPRGAMPEDIKKEYEKISEYNKGKNPSEWKLYPPTFVRCTPKGVSPKPSIPGVYPGYDPKWMDDQWEAPGTPDAFETIEEAGIHLPMALTMQLVEQESYPPYNTWFESWKWGIRLSHIAPIAVFDPVAYGEAADLLKGFPDTRKKMFEEKAYFLMETVNGPGLEKEIGSIDPISGQAWPIVEPGSPVEKPVYITPLVEAEIEIDPKGEIPIDKVLYNTGQYEHLVSQLDTELQSLLDYDEAWLVGCSMSSDAKNFGPKLSSDGSGFGTFAEWLDHPETVSPHDWREFVKAIANLACLRASFHEENGRVGPFGRTKRWNSPGSSSKTKQELQALDPEFWNNQGPSWNWGIEITYKTITNADGTTTKVPDGGTKWSSPNNDDTSWGSYILYMATPQHHGGKDLWWWPKEAPWGPDGTMVDPGYGYKMLSKVLYKKDQIQMRGPIITDESKHDQLHVNNDRTHLLITKIKEVLSDFCGDEATAEHKNKIFHRLGIPIYDLAEYLFTHVPQNVWWAKASYLGQYPSYTPSLYPGDEDLIQQLIKDSEFEKLLGKKLKAILEIMFLYNYVVAKSLYDLEDGNAFPMTLAQVRGVLKAITSKHFAFNPESFFDPSEEQLATLADAKSIAEKDAVGYMKSLWWDVDPYQDAPTAFINHWGYEKNWYTEGTGPYSIGEAEDDWEDYPISPYGDVEYCIPWAALSDEARKRWHEYNFAVGNGWASPPPIWNPVNPFTTAPIGAHVQFQIWSAAADDFVQFNAQPLVLPNGDVWKPQPGTPAPPEVKNIMFPGEEYHYVIRWEELDIYRPGTREVIWKKYLYGGDFETFLNWGDQIQWGQSLSPDQEALNNRWNYVTGEAWNYSAYNNQGADVDHLLFTGNYRYNICTAGSSVTPGTPTKYKKWYPGTGFYKCPECGEDYFK